MSIRSKIHRITSISYPKLFYYNLFCRNIKRDRKCFVIPYRGTHISIDPTARIMLHGNLVLNDHLIGRSRAECLLLFRENASFTVNGNVQLYYGTTLQVHKDAALTMGEAHINTGGTIICAYKMTIGQEVSAGRGVFIYDSDHHPVFNEEGIRINEPKEVMIGDHVWLGLKSTVLKGAEIGSGSVVSAHSLAAGCLPGKAMIATAPARPVKKDISWNR